MTVASTGRRTFFHQRGANALLGESHFDFSTTQAKVFHLGYLMLLDEMDRLLPGGRSVASKVLEKARQAGLITTVDIVSTENQQFRQIAEAALPYTDYLIINEIEAGKVAGLDLRPAEIINIDACAEAARRLLAKGVNQQVVIHFVDGAVVADRQGGITIQGSLALPDGFIVGATGAGDAFAAGYLYGIHEGLGIPASIELAVCSAAACLTHPTPSLGLRPVAECQDLAKLHGRRRIEKIQY
ncbi:MAG: PfkB family carbohydrate kinase [Verrucomicrobiaceae bacterium]|nr:PfkB family carbohydrate kinase [Verrucomicrobiaceae bacterium]